MRCVTPPLEKSISRNLPGNFPISKHAKSRVKVVVSVSGWVGVCGWVSFMFVVGLKFMLVVEGGLVIMLGLMLGVG